MSTIAAKVTSHGIHIASDTIILKDDSYRTGFEKLRKINDIIVGGCGTAEELCLFFEFVKTIKSLQATISAIHNLILEFAEYKEKYTGESKIECEYLIVVDGHLFEVEGFFVREIFDYTAIGTGDKYALAALHLGHDTVEAVKVACDLCCYVSEPIICLETEPFCDC